MTRISFSKRTNYSTLMGILFDILDITLAYFHGIRNDEIGITINYKKPKLFMIPELLTRYTGKMNDENFITNTLLELFEIIKSFNTAASSPNA